MQTILEKLETGTTVATEAQVESLALESYKAGTLIQRTDGIYLRVVVIACQARLGSVGTRRRPINPEAQMTVLEQVHDRYYAAVLRGVTTPDVANEGNLEAAERNRRTLERNRRSNFARQSRSVLGKYVEAGGDLRTLDPATVTKTALREATKPGAVGESEPVTRAQDAIIRAITKQAKEDPSAARAELEKVMDALQAVLDSLDDEPEHTSTTTIVAARSRRNTMERAQLHRSAT
jgi:hypothetical protein